MQRWIIATSSLATAFALSACSGGGNADPSDPTAPTPDYVAFTNSSSAASTELGGQAINTNTNVITKISGTLTHDTRALTDFMASGVTMSDSDGDNAGVWTDGTTTLTPSSASLASYSFAGFYIMQNAQSSASMVVGAATRTADIPTSGMVSYSGDALMQGSSINGTLTGQGNSTVAVNLTNRTAEITINGVPGTAYDTAKFTGVGLSSDRTTLSGGSVALTASGVDVTTNLLGPAPTNTVAGTFFGIDSASNPDEVGGVFNSAGANGSLSGSFLAD